MGLRLLFMAVTLWLFGSAILSLMPQAALSAGPAASPAMEVLSAMVDDVLAAVTLPGAAAVVLIIAAAVINARDVRRRDPVRRFTRQQRRARIPSPGQQLRLERRRRTYVPLDAAVAVGERQPLP